MLKMKSQTEKRKNGQNYLGWNQHIALGWDGQSSILFCSFRGSSGEIILSATEESQHDTLFCQDLIQKQISVVETNFQTICRYLSLGRTSRVSCTRQAAAELRRVNLVAPAHQWSSLTIDAATYTGARFFGISSSINTLNFKGEDLRDQCTAV